MSNRNSFFSRFRLVYRRSPVLLKCVALTAIVVFTAALLVIRSEIQKNQAQEEALRNQGIQLEHENKQLEQNIAQIGTVQGIKRIATEELGLVDRDTILFETAPSTIPE